MGAIVRFFKSIYYLITFKFDKAADAIGNKPGVIAQRYQEIIDKRQQEIVQWKDAIGQLAGQVETKKQKLRMLTEEITKLEKLKRGAGLKAQDRAKVLGGRELAKDDAEFKKFQAAFNDFSSTLAEKEARAQELEQEIEERRKDIQEHEARIKSHIREFEKLKSEKHDAVADIIAAQHEKEIADTLNGVSANKHTEDLHRLRQLRNDAKAKAASANRIADLDTKSDEEAFLTAVESTQSNDEFEALFATETTEIQTVESTKIPEA